MGRNNRFGSYPAFGLAWNFNNEHFWGEGFKKIFNPNEIGGTAMVGISKPVIKAHGSSNGYAIYNAICRAKEMAESDLIQDITANIAHMRISGGKTAEE